ncbi:MAG TPA: NADP-dependent oxidoreductase [Blastocatellia bacterium]|nr:NADP-dependent oxidoreductase [Blastocatellia bacterium]
MPTNRQITLAARPVGYPNETHFKLVESPVPEPGPDQVLLRAIYLSVDPYMRGRMRDVKSYATPVAIGGVMVGGVVAKVEQSNNPNFKQDDYVEGLLGWQEYAVSDGQGLRKLDPTLAPLSTAIGVLGMPGLTAYFGLLDICDPKPGETVFVSGAAGAVGSLVGQIAKIKGCKAVGTAGSDSKIEYLINELGFDAAFNYKTVKDYREKLQELCPAGIDVYFDNVGGALTDAVFTLINPGARVSICGQISQYNLEKLGMGPRMLWTLIVKRARVEGFLVTQFADRFDQGLQEMARWIKEGKLKYKEEFDYGIENAPRAFIGMLKGQNTGKQLVKVSEL